MRSGAAATYLVAVALSARLLAQTGAECATVECARSAQDAAPAAAAASAAPSFSALWDEARRAHELKLRFVEALRQFTEAQAGTFGDEGPALARSVAGMREALAQWDAAVARMAQTAARQAREVEPHIVLGTVYLDRQRAADAIRELAAAIRIDARRVDAHVSLALAQTLAGRPADAVRALHEAARLEPDNAALAYTLGQRLRESGRADDAIEALRRFSRLRGAAVVAASKPAAPFDRVDLVRQASGVAPIFAMQRYAMAFARLDTGDYAGAVDALGAAVASDPLTQGGGEAEVVTRAGALLRGGQIRSVVETLAPLTSNAAGSSEAHRVLGLALWVAGDHNRAIEHLRLAALRRPDDDRARVSLAFVLKAADRPSEAEREAQAAIDAMPRAGQPRFLLGQFLEADSRLPDAARAFDESTSLAPIVGRDRLLQKLGIVRVNQADFDGAIAAYLRRVSVNPNSAEAHRSLGEIYFLQGRDDEALAEFLVAVWLDPSDARSRAGAGQVHLRAQRYVDAVGALSRAVGLDGTHPEWRSSLGLALGRLGRADDAKRELEVAQRLQAEAMARGQRDFQVEQARREAARSLVAGPADVAIAQLQRLVAADPANARVLRDLAAALLRARRAPEAVERAEAAQRLDATADGARLLAEAYAAEGRVAESQEQQTQYAVASQRARLARLRDLDSGL